MMMDQLKKDVHDNTERSIANKTFIEKTFPFICDSLEKSIKSVDTKADESLKILKNGFGAKLTQTIGAVKKIEEILLEHIKDTNDKDLEIKKLKKEREQGWKDTRKSKWKELSLIKKVGIISAFLGLVITYQVLIGNAIIWFGNIIKNLPQ